VQFVYLLQPGRGSLVIFSIQSVHLDPEAGFVWGSKRFELT
jgi:hypothetical protein